MWPTGARVLACLGAACASLALIGAPARAADPVIAAAGDIACDTHERVLQRRARHAGPLPPAGDVGPARERRPLRGAGAGRHPVPRRRPVGLRGLLRPELGARQADHPPDRRATTSTATSDARGYFDYFNGPGQQNGPAGPRDKGYYSFDLGSWHLVALNSNCDQLDRGAAANGCAPGSPQERWLRTDLAAAAQSVHARLLALPRFNSGYRGNSPTGQAFWDALLRGRGRPRAERRRTRLRALRAPGPARQPRPRPGHPPVRGRDRGRLLHRLEHAEAEQRGAPERHLRGARS